MHSPRPVSAESTLRGRTARALYHIPAGMCQKTPIRTDREGERTRIRTGGTINTSMPQHRNAKPAPSPAEQVRLPLQWCVYFRALRRRLAWRRSTSVPAVRTSSTAVTPSMVSTASSRKALRRMVRAASSRTWSARRSTSTTYASSTSSPSTTTAETICATVRARARGVRSTASTCPTPTTWTNGVAARSSPMRPSTGIFRSSSTRSSSAASPTRPIRPCRGGCQRRR